MRNVIHAIYKPRLIQRDAFAETQVRVATVAVRTACGRLTAGIKIPQTIDVSRDLESRTKVTCKACLRVVTEHNEQWAMCGYHYTTKEKT